MSPTTPKLASLKQNLIQCWCSTAVFTWKGLTSRVVSESWFTKRPSGWSTWQRTADTDARQ